MIGCGREQAIASGCSWLAPATEYPAGSAQDQASGEPPSPPLLRLISGLFVGGAQTTLAHGISQVFQHGHAVFPIDTGIRY